MSWLVESGFKKVISESYSRFCYRFAFITSPQLSSKFTVYYSFTRQKLSLQSKNWELLPSLMNQKESWVAKSVSVCLSRVSLCLKFIFRMGDSYYCCAKDIPWYQKRSLKKIQLWCHTKPLLLFWFLRAWQNWLSSAAWDPKLGSALSSKEHTLYLSFLGPNNPPLSSPKFVSCL